MTFFVTRANSSRGAAVNMNNFKEILSEQVRLYRHIYDPSMRDHRDSLREKCIFMDYNERVFVFDLIYFVK